jgi:glycosyltransferase involved in cell wall biosynthesis
MFRWHIITGEYPPQPGGISDYTRLVARELANVGDEVEVWAPECLQPQGAEPGIQVHRLPGHFGPRALAIMDRAIAGANDERVLVQYVPHAFGFKAMNLPFSYWLYARRRWNITVMFHEVAFQRRMVQSIRHNVLGEVTSVMAAFVAGSARRIFVSCLAWEEQLHTLIDSMKKIEWLPVPSNVPTVGTDTSEAIRERYAATGFLVGHFGTYGVKIRDYLQVALPELLQDRRVSVVLLGRGSSSFREALVRRHSAIAATLRAADELPLEDLSCHLNACDLMIQPYPDGISTRRTSAMAALSHGRPVVSTRGSLTESLWVESKAIATTPSDEPVALAALAASLLDNPSERKRLGLAAASLYEARFHLRHTINSLRSLDAHCHSQLDRP